MESINKAPLPQTHVITGWFTLKGTSGDHWSNLGSEQGQLWGQTRFLKSWYSCFLKPLRMETAQPLRGCPTAWLSSQGKSFSTYPIWTSLASSSVVSHSPTMCLCGLKPWPCLLDGLPTDAGWLLLGASKAISSPGWRSPVSSARPQREALQAPTSL